jgi:hypothetical protein
MLLFILIAPSVTRATQGVPGSTSSSGPLPDDAFNKVALDSIPVLDPKDRSKVPEWVDAFREAVEGGFLGLNPKALVAWGAPGGYTAGTEFTKQLDQRIKVFIPTKIAPTSRAIVKAFAHGKEQGGYHMFAGISQDATPAAKNSNAYSQGGAYLRTTKHAAELDAPFIRRAATNAAAALKAGWKPMLMQNDLTRSVEVRDAAKEWMKELRTTIFVNNIGKTEGNDPNTVNAQRKAQVIEGTLKVKIAEEAILTDEAQAIVDFDIATKDAEAAGRPAPVATGVVKAAAFQAAGKAGGGTGTSANAIASVPCKNFYLWGCKNPNCRFVHLEEKDVVFCDAYLKGGTDNCPNGIACTKMHAYPKDKSADGKSGKGGKGGGKGRGKGGKGASARVAAAGSDATTDAAAAPAPAPAAAPAAAPAPAAAASDISVATLQQQNAQMSAQLAQLSHQQQQYQPPAPATYGMPYAPPQGWGYGGPQPQGRYAMPLAGPPAAGGFAPAARVAQFHPGFDPGLDFDMSFAHVVTSPPRDEPASELEMGIAAESYAARDAFRAPFNTMSDADIRAYARAQAAGITRDAPSADPPEVTTKKGPPALLQWPWSSSACSLRRQVQSWASRRVSRASRMPTPPHAQQRRRRSPPSPLLSVRSRPTSATR